MLWCSTPGTFYWANNYTIGRADLNGTEVNQQFISVPYGPKGVAGLGITSRYIYWTNEQGGAIGRANLNGTDVNQRFITGANSPTALAVSSRYIYWTNPLSQTLGRANLDGTDVNQRFITVRIGRIVGVATNSAA